MVLHFYDGGRQADKLSLSAGREILEAKTGALRQGADEKEPS
jgi:hypothetical protein